MNEIKILDLEDALERVGDDSELLVELFGMFLEDCDTNLATLKQAAADGASETIERTAHSMKSAVGNLGAMRAHAAAFALECAGRDSKAEKFQDLYSTFEKEITDFKAAFEEYKSSL